MRKKYKLILSSRAEKDLNSLGLNEKEKKLNLKKLKELETNPYSSKLDVKKIKDKKLGDWRFRTNNPNLRARYDIEGNEIHILRIRKRKEAYKRR